ncbi:MAG: TolC family protein [Chromatiales bacterium]|jgi:outer membrane protein TolC
MTLDRRLRRDLPAVLFCFFTGVVQAAPASLADLVSSALQRDPERGVAAAISAEGAAVRRQADSLFAADPTLVVRHQTDLASGSPPGLRDRLAAAARDRVREAVSPFPNGPLLPAAGPEAPDEGLREWEAGLEIPLWLPGQRGVRRTLADRMERQAELRREARRLAVAGEVRDRLWGLAIARAETRQARLALDSARALERDVARRVEAGELARTDLILARKETLQREADRVTAQERQSLAEGMYRAYTGAEDLPDDYSETERSGASLPEDHAGLGLARALAGRARAERDRVRSERRDPPVLLVGARAERDAAGNDYQRSVGVQLSLPLGLAGQSAPQEAAAERALTEASAELEGTRRELEAALHASLVGKREARRALEVRERQAGLAGEGLRLARRAFELGEGDLFTLLRAREQSIAAERALEVGRLELGQAIARHNQALGVVPQ